ncbi:MAG: group 3/4 sigma-70 RNA polymerase sigma factor [Arthrospira sp. SH-MAG29]|nr:group 3/4 sigma-70 RNA polymerase sigma factor [Arthrospira sp. SH-MAG29]MBS0016138.1 group 3/4 sigma-70 RNA polymerase sigma factor [Arthrospira sp. SH-MAG29]
MQKRTDLVAKFSTFLEVDDARDRLDLGWYCVPRLEHNMRQRRESDRTAKEEYWAKVILREALASAPLAKEHLAAYLEEAAYWTVMKMGSKLEGYQLRKVDFFCMAREATSQPLQLFGRYDDAKSGVKTFAGLTLEDYLSEQLFKGRERDKYSPTGLLRSLSYLELENTLKKRRFSPENIQAYRLLLKCFKEKYVPTKQPGSRALQPPNSCQLQAIALYYNQWRSPDFPDLTPDQVEEYLKNFVDWVRGDAKVYFFSLEELLTKGEEKPSDSPDFFQVSEDEQEPGKEEELNQILSQLFEELTPKIKTLLELVYGLNINQGDLCNFMGFQEQPKLSRFLKKTKQELLTKFAEYAKKNWEINLSSPELNKLVKLINIWLEKHGSLRFHDLLNAKLGALDADDFRLLKLIYGCQLSLADVSENSQLSQDEIKARIKQIEVTLQDTLKSEVETLCSGGTKEMRSLHKRVVDFVEVYLQQAPYAVWESKLKKPDL